MKKTAFELDLAALLQKHNAIMQVSHSKQGAALHITEGASAASYALIYTPTGQCALKYTCEDFS